MGARKIMLMTKRQQVYHLWPSAGTKTSKCYRTGDWELTLGEWSRHLNDGDKR